MATGVSWQSSLPAPPEDLIDYTPCHSSNRLLSSGMVHPDPSPNAKCDSVFDELDGTSSMHVKLERTTSKRAKSDTVQASSSLGKLQQFSFFNVSCLVVLLAVMMVWLRPAWLPPPVDLPSAKNPFQNVFEWVVNKGATIGKIHVIGFDGFYELTATEPIEQGESLLSVPMALILDENVVLADETVQKVLGVVESLDENGAVAVFLLANQEEWGVYGDMIRELDVPSPMFWSESELELLKGSMMNRMMNELRSILSQQFAMLDQFFDFLTLDDYIRLWLNVNSRMWQLQKGDSESVNALMPVFDFATHSTTPNVDIGYDPESNAVVMTSVQEIVPSASIQNFYYNTSNVQHLLFQGFTVEENDAHLACEIEVHENRCQIESNMQSSTSDGIVQCINGFTGDMLSTESVEDIWSKISTSADSALRGFPNTLADDDVLLQREVNPIAYNAIQARRSEKLCLSKIKSFSEMVTAAVTTNAWVEIDAAVAASSDAAKYIASIKASDKSTV